MESLAFIQWCLDHLNYWTITLLMAIESSFIPFPSEIVVPPAAYKAAAGELNIYLVVLFATLGANIGALVNYYLAMWIGRPLIYKFASSRIGHMCLIDEASVMKAEKFFDDNGRISTFVGRLVPAVRQLISTFLIYTTLGAGLWNIILAAIGYYLESVVPQDQLMSKVAEYSKELSWGFIALGILVLGVLIYKGVKKP